jgi:hypothetical protein
VVSVTSTAHHLGRPLDPDDLLLRRDYDAWRAYGRSKLANYHFGIGLERAFVAGGASAASLLAHPGLTNSDLQATTVKNGGGGRGGELSLAMTRRFGMSVADGAMPQLRAATDPAARGGELYAPRWGNLGPAVRRPLLRPGTDEAIRTLWQVSEEQTGIALRV